MRSTDTLLLFEDSCILQQYLYMDETHYLEFINAVGARIRLSMDGECRLFARNMDFPELPPMSCDQTMSTREWLNVVDTLKEMPAEKLPHRFKNRFEEISEMTRGNLALNRKQ